MKPKAKGNTFERKISNLLSERFALKTGIAKAFRRNADSGSFFGGSNVARTATHSTDKATFGDIITPSDFKFSIECKHYKSPPSFSLLVKKDCKEWDKWISQATQDCISANKKMAIIIKYNNVDEIVILDDAMGLAPILFYKDKVVVTLVDFLSLSDSEYFE